MKLPLLIALLTSLSSIGQDSIATKVLYKPVTINDTTYYHVRINWMDRKEIVIMKCCCKGKAIRKKGEIVMIAKKDLIFE